MRKFIAAATLSLVAACDRTFVSDPPLVESSLDTELRASFSQWGAQPIGAVPDQNPALVSLGQSLFFDKVLSGNRDVSCGSCHDVTSSSAMDGLSLSVGTGGTGIARGRTLGAGRQFVPRNAPSILNTGLGFFYTLWDGRINQEGGFGPPGPGGANGQFKGPAGVVLPAGLTNIVAAQAMLPILVRVEMRGQPGDRDVFGNVNELAQISDSNPAAVWRGAMNRVLAIQEYVTKFNAAYPGVPTSSLGFQHAANAIAAFQLATFTKHNSPFDRYLDHDNKALTDEQKRGGILFFGKARCASCHSGALLGGQSFANVGIPQIGPGVGAAAPLDVGRGEHIPLAQGGEFYQFAFRVAPLRNVELTAPYGHNGAYRTLENVLKHYTNPDSAYRAYDVSQLDPALRGTFHGEAETITRVMKNVDFRVKQGIKMTADEQRQIIAFLKSLTDESARTLASAMPASVPSGLPVR
jgi:cytochrome c peroxidase